MSWLGGRQALPSILILLTCLLLWNDILFRATAEAELHNDDFVVAMATDSSRHLLVEASRCWRQVMKDDKQTVSYMRLVAATNSTEQDAKQLSELSKEYAETYFHIDDEDIADPTSQKAHARRAGDMRAALLPALAHSAIGGSYKWMLYGDDDTVFYMRGVKLVLEGLDPEVPMAISDNIWLNQKRPNLGAPRCLPCTDASKVLLANISPSGSNATFYIPPVGCPACNTQAACAFYEHQEGGCRFSGAHGGAGIILSVGLMRLLTLDNLQACLRQEFGCSGGDCLLSRCMWRYNITYTDPGYAVKYNSAHFTVFDNPKGKEILRAPVERLISGRCDTHCRWLIRRAVSHHIQARHMPSIRHAAAAAQALWGSHKLALEFLESMQDATVGGAGGTEWGRRKGAAESEASAALLAESGGKE